MVQTSMCLPETNNPIAVSVADVKAEPMDVGRALIEDLVVANHILFDQGIVDAFGHVSVRHNERPDHFLLARNMAPGSVTAADIVMFTVDGNPINANGRKVYLERFIHGEIYRAFPDVMAVVHSHSPAIVPLSVVKGVPLRAMFHMAGFIGQGAPVFEIRDTGGSATDLLVSSNALGVALAGCFETSDIVLMRGHGSTVIGRTLHQAVYRAVYAELNARFQTTAIQMGEVTYLTDEESKACLESIEGQVHRPWDLWKRQAEAKRMKV
jgi:ribulose-5-phosphate 4-epimerase/fuculose-1-phosphate aldolase